MLTNTVMIVAQDEQNAKQALSREAQPYPLRLLITGGGTGGHVYPGLAVVEAGREVDRCLEILWVGVRGGLEQPLVERAGLRFVGIEAGGLRGMGPCTAARHLVRLMGGFGQAWQVLARFRPDVVLATGGYVTFPVGIAAWLRRVPLVVYLPDIEPGLTVRTLAPFARLIAVTAEPARHHFRGGKAVVTGFPVRATLSVRCPGRQEARERFNIPLRERVVLVFGGSQGAHSLNVAVGHALGALLAEAHVIHIHGRSDGEWLRRRRAELSPAQRARYHLFDYLHEEMAHALAAADLVVARAGASTLGELPAAGVPAILVPYPYSGAHQWANAYFLESQGAAVTVPDEEIGHRLVPLVRELLHDQARLGRMRHAMRQLARPDAARAIYGLLRSLVMGDSVSQRESEQNALQHSTHHHTDH